MTEYSCKEKPEARVAEVHRGKRVLILLIASLGLAMIFGGLLDLLAGGVSLGFVVPFLNIDKVSGVVYCAFVLGAAVYIGFVGLRELVIERRFSVEFLMAVAALGAVYLGFFFEAATVLFLYSLAEYFEGYIQDRARRTVEKLSSFMPDKARVIVDGGEATVNVGEVEIGVILLVRPGERVPLDGNVIEGSSMVDQALVTGESVPVVKRVNDCVYAGTLNVGGVLRVVVTKKSDETLVSKIVKLVIESGKRKASIETLVNRFARFYVPVVISLYFTAVGGRFLGDGFQVWLYRSLMLLVVSCQRFCCLGSCHRVHCDYHCAKRGVIIKGGVFVEKLARVRKVVFDKTGTLTLGKPAVHEVRPVEKAELEALAYAAALDQFSNHPVSKAIVRKALERGIDLGRFKVKDVTEVPGEGIVGFVNGVHVAVGNLELMRNRVVIVSRRLRLWKVMFTRRFVFLWVGWGWRGFVSLTRFGMMPSELWLR
jgi:Cd2+/Zn2+-exporting ATPase